MKGALCLKMVINGMIVLDDCLGCCLHVALLEGDVSLAKVVGVLDRGGGERWYNCDCVVLMAERLVRKDGEQLEEIFVASIQLCKSWGRKELIAKTILLRRTQVNQSWSLS